MLRCFYIIFIAIAIMTTSTLSQIPRQISWQGVITDDLGAPLNGNYTITMKIFNTDNPNVIIPLWSEVFLASIDDGMLNITLGLDLMNPLTLDFDQPYWLEIKVGEALPMSRVRLTSSPYSMMARTVEDDAITTQKILNDAVTNDKILSVDWLKITNAPVSLPPSGPAGGDLTGNYPSPLIAPGAVINTKIANGTVVRSIGSATKLTDDVRLVAGENVIITDNYPNINDITITSVMGGPAGGDLAGTYPNPSIAPLAVTTGKLANQSVTTSKIAPLAVTTDELGNSAVTGVKIASNTVVRSIGNLEQLRDNVRLVEGANIKIEDNTPDENQIRISSLIPDVIVLEDGEGNKTEISAKEVKQTKSGSNKTTNIKIGDGVFKDESGNETTVTATGTTTKDPNGNETTTTATGSKSTDNAGNSSETTAAGTKHTDKDGNTTESTAAGTKSQKTNPENGDVSTTSTTAEGINTRREDEDGNMIGESNLSPDGLTIEDGDGNKMEIGADGISMKDSSGAPIFEVKPDGSSYHKGKEVFAGGIEVQGEDEEDDGISIDNGMIVLASPTSGDVKTITPSGNYHANMAGGFNNATPQGNIIGDSDNNLNESNSVGNSISNSADDMTNISAGEAEYSDFDGNITRTHSGGLKTENSDEIYVNITPGQIDIETTVSAIHIEKPDGEVLMHLEPSGNLTVPHINTKILNMNVSDLGPLDEPVLRIKNPSNDLLRLDFEGLYINTPTNFEESVGIGTDSPTELLQVGQFGDGTRAVANAWEEFSDVNLKRDLIKLTNASCLLKNINAYYYFWKSGSDDKRQFGLIAQEVEEVLPEIVSTNVNGIKTLDYSKLSALLIEVVKEQQSSINRLQNQILYLNEKIKNLDDMNHQNMKLSDEIDEIKIMMKHLNKQISEKRVVSSLSTIDK